MISYNKRFKSLILGLSATILSNIIVAQTTENPLNSIYSEKLSKESTSERMVFKKDSKVKKDDFLLNLSSGVKTLARTNQTNSFLLHQTSTDQFGMTHTKYKQTINGVIVEGAIVKFHELNGFLTSVSNQSKSLSVASTVPSITETEATQKAFVYSGAVSLFVNGIIKPNKPELIISVDNKGVYVLTWKIDLIIKEPYGRENIYVNAISGELVKRVNQRKTCGNPSVQTRYNGYKNINDNTLTQDVTFDNLFDNCRTSSCGTSAGGNITTLYFDNSVKDNFYYIKQKSSSWPTDKHQQIGNSVHWGLGKLYDYYKCIHDRNSFDNQDGPIYGVTHVNYYTYDSKIGPVLDPGNAAWNGSYMEFGDGADYYTNTGTLGAVVSLDIIGHEMTHGVTQHAAGLEYIGESGALNEAWSDILGTDFEFYVNGANGNYNLGEDVWLGGVRSLSNPNSKNQPDTYMGTYWASTDNVNIDNGGVHTNSGVANYWFYLLSQGGSGTNDVGSVYNVTAITRAIAAKIAYRALDVYFTPTTNFAEARSYTIQAARDLYGDCSAEALQTANAWYAVGVGGNVLADNFTAGPTTLCAGGHVSYNAMYSTDITPSLTLPLGATSGNYSNGGPDHQVGDLILNSSGFFKLTLTDAKGCSNSKTINITVNPLPTIGTISGSSTMCTGKTNQLACTPSGGTWGTSNPNLATVSTSGLVSATIQAVDKPVISYSLVNAYGCTNKATKTIQVYASPTVGVISGNSTVCIGVPTTLTCTPTGGTWSSSNSSIASISNVGVVNGLLSNSTNPTISYAVTNGSGTCVSTASKAIQVLNVPTTGNSWSTPIEISNNITCGFTYTNSNNTSNCFTNTWGTSSPEVYYKFTITAPRKLRISTCGSSFDTKLYVLSSSIIAENDDNGPLCTGTNASINYNFTTAGTYYIVVEGYGAAKGAYMLNVSVDPSSNCSATRSGAIDDDMNSIEALVVFPNPAQDYIQVNKPGTKIIYNSLGVEVIRSENDLIDINILPTGIYIINVIQDGIVERATFVKN